MITIQTLEEHPNSIETLAHIWHETIGKKWRPNTSLDKVIQTIGTHKNYDQLPLVLIALDGDKPVGMCCLRENDGIRPDTTPWLGPLVVDPFYQGRGIGKLLIQNIKEKAFELGFRNLHLFTFDPDLPEYYERLGWHKIGTDTCNNHPVTVMQIDL